jgi:glycosyltransferase involved in cell wall biosynthesis
MPAHHQTARVGAGAQLPRVVIAHDFMETYGGAERITAEIARAFPEAPVYAIAGRRAVAQRMGVADRFTSLLAPRPRFLRHYRLLAPVFPAIVDGLRLPPADVVVSSSYAYAHRLRAANGAPRICYSYSPMRFAWSMREDYRDLWSGDRISRLAFEAFAAAMRVSDRRSAQSVARYLAPGNYVAEQLQRFYGRESEIIGAPVDCDVFRPTDAPPGDYFLFCGRLIEPYKKVNLLVETFNRSGHRLVIAGDGPERTRLEQIAAQNIEFAGPLEDTELVELMQRCMATVFPSQDDFGLIPVEVNACGRPVIAFRSGGALHTVRSGITGEFFDEQTAGSLGMALGAFDPGAYDPHVMREHALAFDSPRFRERLIAAVHAELGYPSPLTPTTGV